MCTGTVRAYLLRCGGIRLWAPGRLNPGDRGNAVPGTVDDQPGGHRPRTTEHYARARGNLDRHGVHFLTADVAGV